MSTWLLEERWRLGQLVRFHRTQSGQSLRMLETRMGRSHTWFSLVEQGEVVMEPAMWQKVCAALSLSPSEDTQQHEMFQEAYDMMLERYVYGDSQALTGFIGQWVDLHERMLLSVDVVDYLLAMALTAPFDEAGQQPWSTAEVLNALKPLIAIMTSMQRFIWYLVHGRLLLGKHRYEAARQALDQALNEPVSPALEDIGVFFRVQALSQSYRLYDAMRTYDRLIENFERRGQLYRAIETKLASVMNLIRMHHLDSARIRLEGVADFVRQRGRRELFRPMIEMSMLLYLLKGEHETVLRYAAELKVHSPRSGFYQAYAAERLQRPVDDFQIAYEDDALEPHARLYLRLTRHIRHHQNHHEAQDEAVNWLLEAYEDFKRYDLFPEATLIYDTLKETLTRARRYKEAYQVTLDMIEMVKKMLN
ncbi:MAG: XRE family transcriptional regulator [Acholeplasmatales bacterium]|nr:MAG: XRE family transcriptional regulator [Acholeplasmatales bacterium]